MKSIGMNRTVLRTVFKTILSLSMGTSMIATAQIDDTIYRAANGDYAAVNGYTNDYNNRSSSANRSNHGYHAGTDKGLYISKQKAANPNYFKRLSVNGRAVAYAIAPCNSQQSLIACAMDKLKVHDVPFVDTYNVQDFYYPDDNNAKVGVVVVTYYGLKDDAVSAERYRVSFIKQPSKTSPSQQEWHLVQYGYQQRCDRSVEARYWTTSSCP